MSKNYLVIDGKRIELSKETIDNLKLSIPPKSSLEVIMGEVIDKVSCNFSIKELDLLKPDISYLRGDFFVTVNLPGSNTEWTLAAYRFVTLFCGFITSCYPYHYDNPKFYHSDKIYICCSSYAKLI